MIIIEIKNNIVCGAMRCILEMPHKSVGEGMILGTLICKEVS